MMQGLIQVDAPTVQRTSFFLFLHCVVSWGWIPFWRNGDISNAFLQGQEFDFGKRKPTYMRPPKEGLPGISSQQLLRLRKPVYGLPEAPRAWYNTLRSALEKLGFQISVIDSALFIHRDESGFPDALVTTHVDDIMIATNGNRDVEALVQKLQETFPFGEWDEVAKTGCVTYCGKQISVEVEDGNQVISVSQSNFCEGRLSEIVVDKNRRKHLESPVTDQEKSDFRSTLGCLQWLSTQTRLDLCFCTNQLQKRINDLRVKDLLATNQLVREAKRSEVKLIFRNLGKDTAIVAFHDAGLYSSIGVEVDERQDEHLGQLDDKRKLFSQKGVVVGIVKREDLNMVGPAKLNVLDWKSKTNRRVVESSFQGEVHGTFMGYDMGHFARVLTCELEIGPEILKWDDDNTPWNNLKRLVLCTDCKSVYDAVHKSQQSIGDRAVALGVAGLRQVVSTNTGDVQRATLLWIPTRFQIADPLTKANKGAIARMFLRKGDVHFRGLSARELKSFQKPKDRVSVNLAS